MLPHGLSNYDATTSSLNRQAKRQVLAKASGQTPSTRRSISDRIEQLKRQNDSLKQAIGLFLDQPQDVGAITGKPTGAWDEGSTASLLDTLSRKRPVVEQSSEDAASDGDYSTQSTSDDKSAVVQEVGNLYEQAQLPAGPVFDTDLAGPAWMDAASYPDTNSSISRDSWSVDSSNQDAPTSAASSTAVTAAAADPGAPPAAPDTSPPAAPADGSWPSPSSAAATVVGALAALQADILKAVSGNGSSNGTAAAAAAAVEAPPKPSVLGRIHERVAQMEREQQQQQKEASKQQTLAVKPRAKARRPPPVCSTPLNIVFVSAEVAPWSKTGGLGDVMGALPQAMADRGHRVMVVVPRYTNNGKDLDKYKDATALEKSVWVELNGSWHELKYHHLYKGGVDWVFIEHMAYQREGTPYGNAAGPFQDNLFRFALLCLGALEAPLNLPIKRDSSGQVTDQVYGQNIMFVASDWHAALLPTLLAARFRPYGVYEHARCCLAIHNLAHQGSYEAHKFHDVGLPGEWYGTLEWQIPGDAHRRKTINVLKSGIVTSDLLITVSQGYAAEITGKPQDARVDRLLAQRAPKLRGIVNGIDVVDWDPASDKHLAARYSADDLSGKAVCKRALQREMLLPIEPDIPLIGFIGRLDYQKGPDLVLDGLPVLGNLDCQVG
eukprot:GHUV01020582.1.p1 GENE.GHUV01020582.1~~GHUV01020582.1.p1  ORF type:complete len:664 (+),score=179.93 GHUV01020582.1:243-2234(+)